MHLVTRLKKTLVQLDPTFHRVIMQHGIYNLENINAIFVINFNLLPNLKVSVQTENRNIKSYFLRLWGPTVFENCVVLEDELLEAVESFFENSFPMSSRSRKKLKQPLLL